MFFTFDIHTIQDKKGCCCMVPCYVITHSNNSETKFHHVIKFDQWNASLFLHHDKQASVLWLVYYTVVFNR